MILERWVLLLQHIPPFYYSAYFVIINTITMLLYIVDKRAAMKRTWRIPEATLHLFMFLGGTVGALAGMHIIRHKTKKKRFQAKFYSLLFIQILVIYYISAPRT